MIAIVLLAVAIRLAANPDAAHLATAVWWSLCGIAAVVLAALIRGEVES